MSVVREQNSVSAERSTFALTDPGDLPESMQDRYRAEPLNGSSAFAFYKSGETTAAFADEGNRLSAGTADPEVVAELLSIVEHRKWDRVTVTGAEEFRRELWREATLRGLEVDGYKPNEREEREVAAARAEREDIPGSAGRVIERDDSVPAAPAPAPERTSDTEPTPQIDDELADDELVRDAFRKLAEKFRNGEAEEISADPLLRDAVRAQELMELHIAAHFAGDPTRIMAANLESREMVADVLASGQQVALSPRERQQEITHVQAPEMER